MAQAIQTKFLGPTNHKGSRVKATCDAGSAVVSWDYNLDTEGNHRAAAWTLCAKLAWEDQNRTLVTGWLGHTAVHVFAPR